MKTVHPLPLPANLLLFILYGKAFYMFWNTVYNLKTGPNISLQPYSSAYSRRLWAKFYACKSSGSSRLCPSVETIWYICLVLHSLVPFTRYFHVQPRRFFPNRKEKQGVTQGANPGPIFLPTNGPLIADNYADLISLHGN